MDHNEAIQLQAAVKYVLGELSQPERDAYEEHYFDCSLCAVDVKAAAGFLDASRDLLRQESVVTVPNDSKTARGGWFAWFRPIVAVPAFAALLLTIAYQNTVTIPKAEEKAARGSGQLFSSSFSLQMANVRGEDEVKVRVHSKEGFALDFDFTPTVSFDSYICQLLDESGRSLLQVSIPGSSVNKEVHLAVPGGLVQPGKYHLAFTGAAGLRGQPATDQIPSLGFSVDILQ